MRVLAWIGAWALVVAAASVLPTWVAIALAVAVFAAQLLLARSRDLPPAGRQAGRRDKGCAAGRPLSNFFRSRHGRHDGIIPSR
jgi:hypothetical protein